MKAIARLFVAACLCLSLGGCAGYHLGPTQPLPYRTVAVPMFKNKTLHPQLEAQITNATIKRFQTDGTLQVESVADADVIVKGQITRFYRRLLRVYQADALTPREYRIIIEASVEVRDRVTNELLLTPTLVQGTADTFIGSDEQAADEQALPLVADDLAKHVVSLLVEKW
jgi:hypothetical protein